MKLETQKRILVVATVLLAVYAFLVWYNRPERGIHKANKNAVLIEGSCVTFNWDSTEAEVDQAVSMWRELKK